MGIWEFIKLLVTTRDNPLVKYGARCGGGYVLLSVTLFYLVIGCSVWFLKSLGMYDDVWFLFMGATGISAVWVGICLAMFTPKFHGRDNLEELWLCRLSQKEVLIGLLRRPMLVCLYSMAAPYLVYCFCILYEKRHFDELLTAALILPLASAMIGWAVFSRRWLLRSQGVVRYFLLGTLESGLYVFFAFIASLCVMLVGFVLLDWDYSGRRIQCYLTLWAIPVLFGWLKCLQVLRDAPERLFRHIDEQAYLKRNWFARENKAWSDVAYRKRAVRRQKSFFRVRLKQLFVPMLLFGLFLCCLCFLGYLLHPSLDEYRQYYSQWSHIGEMSGVFSLRGPLQVLFGFSGYMGLSFFLPLFIVQIMTGKFKHRDLPIFPGTMPATLLRFGFRFLSFLVLWTLVGYILRGIFLPEIPFMRRDEEWVLFLMIQSLLFLPISCGVFMLLASRQHRVLWKWVVFGVAMFFFCVPLFYLRGNYREGLYFYSVSSDVDALMFILYILVGVFLYGFGFDWLGRRCYQSKGLVE